MICRRNYILDNSKVENLLLRVILFLYNPLSPVHNIRNGEGAKIKD